VISPVTSRPVSRGPDVGLEGGDQGVGVGEQQALAPVDPHQVDVPVVPVGGGVRELAGPDHVGQLPGAPHDHSPDCPERRARMPMTGHRSLMPEDRAFHPERILAPAWQRSTGAANESIT
jgi:hypothetical protein